MHLAIPEKNALTGASPKPVDSKLSGLGAQLQMPTTAEI
jgi:hypothetical protein